MSVEFCVVCGQSFPKKGNKIFCSQVCRLYHQREKWRAEQRIRVARQEELKLLPPEELIKIVESEEDAEGL